MIDGVYASKSPWGLTGDRFTLWEGSCFHTAPLIWVAKGVRVGRLEIRNVFRDETSDSRAKTVRIDPDAVIDSLDGVTKECEILELRMLPDICNQGKKVFVDTNICIETLRKIAPLNHTLVMLADPEIPLHRFFDRPDPEKQFLYRLIMEEPDPEKAMENYRAGLKLFCSQEGYDKFEKSGFHVIYRDESRTVEQTVALAEEALGLK